MDLREAAYDQQHHLEICWEEMLNALVGHVPDLDKEGLRDTPTRAAKALTELTSGYHADVASLFTTFEGNGYDEMVVLRDVQFSSLCEHHVLPFTGQAHIAYVPDQHVLGLSKLARVVEVYARRLQLQERMTMQIAEAIDTYLKPRGVAVVVEGVHSCMALRGVRKPGATMVTSALRGVLWKPEARAEALALLRPAS